MPLFEYRCSDCGAKFDELVTSADETVACPTCQSTNAQKLLSTFSASVASSSGATAPSCGRPACGSGFS